MKKLLIVNDNLNIGGIQKSLLNLVNERCGMEDMTLFLLFSEENQKSLLPAGIKVIVANPMLGVLGASKKALKGKPLLYAWKGFLKLVAEHTSRKVSIRIAELFQKRIACFDVAISYSHPGAHRSLLGTGAEFVLDKVEAKEKICFVHEDYLQTVNRSAYTDDLYRRFDKIACCSDSVKAHFLTALPELAHKTYTVRNFYDLSLQNIDKQNCMQYSNTRINIVMLARLTSEKGVDRAVRALEMSKRNDINIIVVGEGPERVNIEQLIVEAKLEKQIKLVGETPNPEFYLKNADYLMLTSYHEAAPIVFDEARLMGVRCLSTETTSAYELIENNGVICSNTEEGICEMLKKLKKDDQQSEKFITWTNGLQKEQFERLIGISG